MMVYLLPYFVSLATALYILYITDLVNHMQMDVKPFLIRNLVAVFVRQLALSYAGYQTDWLIAPFADGFKEEVTKGISQAAYLAAVKFILGETTLGFQLFMPFVDAFTLLFNYSNLLKFGNK